MFHAWYYFSREETIKHLFFYQAFMWYFYYHVLSTWEVLSATSKIVVFVHLYWIRISTMHFLLIEPFEVPGLEGHGWRKAGVSTFKAHQRTIEQCAESGQSLALIRYFLNVCMFASGKDGKFQVINWEQNFYRPLQFYKNWRLICFVLFCFFLTGFPVTPLVRGQCLYSVSGVLSRWNDRDSQAFQ